MVYIGAMLASIKIKSAIRQKSIYLLSLNKLLIVPVALAVVDHIHYLLAVCCLPAVYQKTVVIIT